MTENRVDVGTVDELSQEELVKFAIDGLRRIIVHYGFWFKETEHQLGLEKAFDIENNVWKLDFLIQMKRLSKLQRWCLVSGGGEGRRDVYRQKV